MEKAIIETQNLNFSYDQQPVIWGVNLRIQTGDFLAMIGPNGGGKTTLLKLMLGLLNADSGTIRIFGKPPKLVSHRIGYVPQDVHINQNFPISSSDVVLMGKIKPGKGWSRHSKEDRMAALQALEQVGMGKYRDHRIGVLSGGQKQRVFIARALVTDPDILFLDEPTAGIDTKGQNEFYAILKELNHKITIIVVSHD
ncbi:MAG: ABC transporter ATP-binding protein, partial [bacterium]|nr:ABC transporter ATP-binding protein [bacterium]